MRPLRDQGSSTWPAQMSPFSTPAPPAIDATPSTAASSSLPVRLRSPLDIPADEEIGVTTSTEANW